LSKQDLVNVWQKYSKYLVLFALTSWLVTQGVNVSSSAVWHQSHYLAALFGLIICMPLYLVCLWFASTYVLKFGGNTWHSRLPAVDLKDEPDFSSPEARMYQRIVFIVYFIFPLAANSHFFNVFLDAPVYQLRDHLTVNLWQFPPTKSLVDDAYRFGAQGGVTFFPFYEPLLISLVFVGIWIYFLRFAWLLFRPGKAA
jgi:hypothetical protein